MVVIRSQVQILINQFNNLSTNHQVQMFTPVLKYVIIPFEGNINPVDLHGLKLYLQATKE